MEANLVARDWDRISFKTEPDARRTDSRNPAASNFTGAGTVGANTQFWGSYVTGYPSSATPVRGAMEVTFEDAAATLLDVTGMPRSIDYDPETSSYYLTLQTPDAKLVELHPPFTDLPAELQPLVVYRSARPDSLVLRAPLGDACCKKAPAGLTVFAAEQAPFGWNLRPNCDYELHRMYDRPSESLTAISIGESCPADLALDPQDPSLSGELTQMGTIGAFLLLPISYSVIVSDTMLYSDPGSDLIVIVEADWLQARPASAQSSIYVSIPGSDMDSAVERADAALTPAAHRIKVEAPVGKLGLGRNSYVTDETSNLTVTYKDWPTYVLRNNWAPQSDNVSAQRQQLLYGSGVAASLLLNGEEFVLNRWDQQSPEIRATILGSLIAAFVAFAVSYWENWRNRQKRVESAPVEVQAGGTSSSEHEPEQQSVFYGDNI
ncbi:MAG: hypothetical protein U0X20_31205 [Caldilineaceae bacterium]